MTSKFMFSVHTLPNLTVLSLSGCSKITDDGIELIAENLRKLRSLDVSWCPRQETLNLSAFLPIGCVFSLSPPPIKGHS